MNIKKSKRINENIRTLTLTPYLLWKRPCLDLSDCSSGLIVASLMLCWLPNQIRRLMMAAVPKSRWSTSYFRSYIILHPVADTFFYFSSVINPLLYNLSSRQFREVFVQVLRCRLTIEHINKRTVPSPRAVSSRSIQPLLRSLRRKTGGSLTRAQEKTLPTSQKENHPEVVPLDDAEAADLVIKMSDVPSDTEV